MNSRIRSATRGALAAVLVLAVAGSAPAFAGDTKSAGAKTRDSAPGIDRMLERKAELGLTAEQETRLAEIRKELQAKNRPLVEQIESVIGERPTPEQMKSMTDEQREDFVIARHAEGKSHHELQPVYKQMRENRKAAWEQVKEVLNPDQEAKVEKWAKDKKKEMGAKSKKAKPKDASAEPTKTY